MNTGRWNSQGNTVTEKTVLEWGPLTASWGVVGRDGGLARSFPVAVSQSVNYIQEGAASVG